MVEVIDRVSCRVRQQQQQQQQQHRHRFLLALFPIVLTLVILVALGPDTVVSTIYHVSASHFGILYPEPLKPRSPMSPKP